MSNQLVGVNRRVHPYGVFIFGQDRLLQQLGAFKDGTAAAWGKGNVCVIPVKYKANQKICLYLRLDVHVLNPCSSTMFFLQFHGLDSKENPCSG